MVSKRIKVVKSSLEHRNETIFAYAYTINCSKKT